MKLAKWSACLAAAGLLLIAGCNKKESSSESRPPEQPKAAEPAKPPAETPSAVSNTEAKSETPAAVPHGDDASLLRPARLKDKAPDKYQVRFETTRGAFTVTVTRAWAPIGADRFYNLVKHHFYDDAAFFRVVPGFVVQFGISSYPKVAAAWKHTDIKDDPVTQTNKRGYLTFATAGPDTRTTQVFINLKENQRLDAMGFAPFGVVDGQGMNVVDMLYDVYGDAGGPDQDQIEKQGEPYLKKGWPKLDYLKTATLVQ